MIRRCGAVAALALLAALVVVPDSSHATGVPAGRTPSDEVNTHPVAHDPGSMSWLAITGEQDSYSVVRGRSRLNTSVESSFRIAGSPEDGVTVRVTSPGDANSLGFTFEAPEGESLTEGVTYAGTRSERTPDRAAQRLSLAGGACDPSDGSFTVHDITPDLGRLWISFVHSCGATPAGPTETGELRLNEPAGTLVRVAPVHASWGVVPVAEPGRPTPTTVSNPSGRPLTLGGLEVTSGHHDFFVLHDTCGGILPAYGFCRIYTQFRPWRTGVRRGLLTIRTGVGPRTVRLAGVGAPAVGAAASAPVRTRATQQPADARRTTVWRIHSDSDAVVPGSYEFRADEIRSAGGSESGFGISTRRGSNGFGVGFSADHDHVVVPGLTVTPVRTTYPDGPYDTGSLSVSGLSYTCGTVAARKIKVFEATYDRTGALTGIAFSYTLRCRAGDENQAGEDRGVVAWNATCVPGLPHTLGANTCYPVGGPPPPPPGQRAGRVGLVLGSRSSVRVELRGLMRPARATRFLVVERRARAGEPWSRVRQVRTEVDGRFRTVVPRDGLLYRARYAGSPSIRAAVSRAIQAR